MNKLVLLAWLLLAWTMGPAAIASDVDFPNEIQTVLARRCYACHGPDTQEGEIRFDVRETLIGEADSGEITIQPGDAEASELLRRITSDDEYERMPPEGKPLTESEVDAFRRWIDAGAKFEKHWAFQPVSNPELPVVEQTSWSQQPLDRFILSRLEQASLRPASAATPAQLIRRVYMDTIGLPPSPEIVAELSSDWSAETYERLVENLLSNPAFGERWARTWLDVVRYAETNSFERDNPKPNAWRYRDYVIRAMNSDKPYDQFVREQLAGDELDEVTTDSLTATGYYRLGIWDDEPADPLQARFDEFDDLVTTTSQGFLALTLNCARCHDHKIDPLTQKEYYSMVAFMRDVTPYGTKGDHDTNNQVDLKHEDGEKHRLILKKTAKLELVIHEMEQAAITKMSATDQRATEGPEREKVLRSKIQDYMDESDWEKYSALKAEKRRLNKRRRRLPPRDQVLGLAKTNPTPEQTFVQLRGSPHAQGDPVEPAFPKLVGGGVPQFPEPDPNAKSAGRRRVLADWIAADDNWMTSRVIVNRIWGHYFGRGIVRSPNNFGLMGDPPTHPQLLDHLATTLVQNQWSLKSIHRTLLLSSAYQMSVEANDRAADKDPANNLFWRQNLRRLSAEQIRDSVLSVTGQLNRQQFGQSMYPTMSAEVLASQSQPGKGWEDSTAAQQARRSVYIHIKRSLPVPMMAAFDFPETDITCEARFLTTQPGQALTMLNSDWMQEQASQLFKRLQRDVGDDLFQQATRCLELVKSRPGADIKDVQALVELTQKLQREHGLTDAAARQAMCLISLNLNQFFYLE